MEAFRLQYPLNDSSLVLDVGGFRGDFVDWCRKRWSCRVETFEPLASFCDGIKARFANDPDVIVHDYGLGARSETRDFSVRGDSSSAYFDSNDPALVKAEIRLVDVVLFFRSLEAPVDLMKINIEGGEYALLPRMLDTGLVRRVRYFQVQYHGIGAGPEGAAAARDSIREQLSDTHKEQWCVNSGQWESWEVR